MSNAAARLARVREPVSVLDLLTWAFSVERVSLDFEDVAPRRVDPIYAMMRQAELGARIDGGGWSPRATDAEIVAGLVAALPAAQGGRRMAVTVAELARAGQVPDWMPGAVPRLVPVEWKRANQFGRGTARTDVAGHWEEERWIQNPRCAASRIRRVRRHELRYCPCRWSPSRDRIAAARRFYLDWWGALLHLQAAFRAADLGCFEVTQSMPPLTPWRGSTSGD